MSLELIIAGALLRALTVYVLTGGADYGAGVWYLSARGARSDAHLALIDQAIAPIWETNHVWLIFVLVLLFTAFPPAFTAIVVSLHIPLTLLLIGIVMRGASFAFRHADVPFGELHVQWERLFALASLLTPFWLGVVIGTIAAGLPAASGGFVATFISPWLVVFPKYKVVGVFQKDKQFVGGSAVADVTKQVEFEFKWPLEDGVSPKVLPNIPTKAERYRDGSAVCPAPMLKGAYEHFELKSILVMGPMFGLVGERRTPDMDEYVGGGGCKGTHPVQGQVSEEQVLVTLPPEFLAGQLSKGQVFTQQDQGWTWTFTPVP